MSTGEGEKGRISSTRRQIRTFQNSEAISICIQLQNICSRPPPPQISARSLREVKLSRRRKTSTTPQINRRTCRPKILDAKPLRCHCLPSDFHILPVHRKNLSRQRQSWFGRLDTSKLVATEAWAAVVFQHRAHPPTPRPDPFSVQIDFPTGFLPHVNREQIDLRYYVHIVGVNSRACKQSARELTKDILLANVHETNPTQTSTSDENKEILGPISNLISI